MTTTVAKSLKDVVLAQWNDAGKKVVELARALPARAYDFRPAKEVRSVEEVLRHLVFWNRWVEAAARGESPDGSANEIPKSEAPSKPKLVAALEESAARAAAVLAKRPAELDAETAETFAAFVGHTAEHYGQLVVYCRLNGVVPPASRT